MFSLRSPYHHSGLLKKPDQRFFMALEFDDWGGKR
jgi:hypothetical protein